MTGHSIPGLKVYAGQHKKMSFEQIYCSKDISSFRKNKLSLGELRCTARCLQTVLKFFDCRFSLILRAFPAFHCSVILCGNHEK